MSIRWSAIVQELGSGLSSLANEKRVHDLPGNIDIEPHPPTSARRARLIALRVHVVVVIKINEPLPLIQLHKAVHFLSLQGAGTTGGYFSKKT